jgi:hypothetical protein
MDRRVVWTETAWNDLEQMMWAYLNPLAAQLTPHPARAGW